MSKAGMHHKPATSPRHTKAGKLACLPALPAWVRISAGVLAASAGRVWPCAAARHKGRFSLGVLQANAFLPPLKTKQANRCVCLLCSCLQALVSIRVGVLCPSPILCGASWLRIPPRLFDFWGGSLMAASWLTFVLCPLKFVALFLSISCVSLDISSMYSECICMYCMLVIALLRQALWTTSGSSTARATPGSRSARAALHPLHGRTTRRPGLMLPTACTSSVALRMAHGPETFFICHSFSYIEVVMSCLSSTSFTARPCPKPFRPKTLS